MTRILFLSLPLLFAAACTQTPTANTSSVDINSAALQAQDAVDAYGSKEAVEIGETDAVDAAGENIDDSAGAATRAPLDPPAPGTPGGLADDRTPVSEAAFGPDSAQGAAAIVQTYYALLGERHYAQAFALRDPGSAEAPSAAAFAASFARYSEYHANVGAPGAIDAGAGQRYVTVPVQVYARLKQGGTPVYQIGSVTLHRTGDVDGATAAQRSWRIGTIAVKTAPAK